MKTLFITGTSSGFGRSLAQRAIERGYNVVATARNPKVIGDLVELAPNRVLAVELDVTDEASVVAAVESGLQRFGQLDVLVNNAGFGMMGAIEEVSDAEARKVFDTNVFGLLAVTRAVLPSMRERRSGHILNISSIGGFVSFAGPAVYCGTKFAVEGISEGMSKELVPLGIRVTIVEPGAFRTDFSGRSLMLAERKIPDYESVRKFVSWAQQNADKFPGDPNKAADGILIAIEANEPPLRLALGPDTLSAIRKKLRSVEEEASIWEHVTVNTNYPDAEPMQEME
jgi:NAD(P)-dependent dehydrogenase (short-subunit alcohol dehydrogenase family)